MNIVQVFLFLLFLLSLLKMLMDVCWVFEWMCFLFLCTCMYHIIFNIKYSYLLKGYVYNNFTIIQNQIILVIKVISDGEELFVFFSPYIWVPFPLLSWYYILKVVWKICHAPSLSSLHFIWHLSDCWQWEHMEWQRWWLCTAVLNNKEYWSTAYFDIIGDEGHEGKHEEDSECLSRKNNTSIDDDFPC